MATFKFRLATLLRLRECARDERRAQLAQAYQAEEVLRAQQRRLAQECRQLEQLGREASGPGPVDLDRLLETRRYALVLNAQQRDLQQKAELLEAEIDRRRQALLEATRDVRALEVLRQRQLERHRQEEHRQEIKTLDEVAGRVARKEAR